MGKSFNEMARLLKDLIKDMNNDAHNAKTFKEERYNNMKITMDPSKDPQPHVTIQIGMSEGTYSLSSQQRTSGSLGPDEKYVTRWMNRSGIMDSLKDLWRDAVMKDKESIDASQLEDIEELKKKKARDNDKR